MADGGLHRTAYGTNPHSLSSSAIDSATASGITEREPTMLIGGGGKTMKFRIPISGSTFFRFTDPPERIAKSLLNRDRDYRIGSTTLVSRMVPESIGREIIARQSYSMGGGGGGGGGR